VYVVMNRIPVHPDFSEAFEERFRRRAGAVDRMPGFIRTMVLRPENGDDPYVVLTMWESKEHYIAWTQSERSSRGTPALAGCPRRRTGAQPPGGVHHRRGLGPS